jgi:hypothetical protein
METKNGTSKARNALIIALFSIGAVVGFALLLVSVWGDVEASMFNPSQKGEERLTSLACPVILTPQDTGKFSAKISNPIERKIKPSLRVHISSGHLTLIKEENVKFELEPNESKELTWSVDPEDAAYGKMVLVKVYQFRNYPIPSKDGTCGIYVLDIPTFSGQQILYGGMGVSFAAMLGSVVIWQKSNRLVTKRQQETFRSMTILTGTIIIGVAASLMGSWLIGSLGIVVALLLTVTAITKSF